MDIVEHESEDGVLFESYEQGVLTINGVHYAQGVVLGEGQVLPLLQKNIHEISMATFAPALDVGVGLIIIGTGEKQQFIAPQIKAQLSEKGVGLECMTTAAACRTLMMLQSEGRHVWAWLFC